MSTKTKVPYQATILESGEIKPKKAYKNDHFLGSRDARVIRILCEYEETCQRLKENEVQGTMLFFGSARSKNEELYKKALSDAEAALEKASSEQDKRNAKRALDRLKKTEWLCQYHEKIRELAKKIAEWSVTRAGLQSVESALKGGGSHLLPENGAASAEASCAEDTKTHLAVCTGGGPGFMEAANKGAFEVEGAKSMGMGISLPFEPGLNPYVQPELGFEYHYFFTRKFWMVYPCLGLVVAPGGFGTLDEMFEVLTLKQTGKVKRDIPVVLFGKKFWSTIINFEALVEFGTISQQDYDSLYITDSVEDAFHHLTTNCGDSQERSARRLERVTSGEEDKPPRS